MATEGPIKIEVTSSVPFIKKYDKSFEGDMGKLLDALKTIGHTCFLYGPTRKDILENNSYLFSASLDALIYNPKGKEYISNRTTQNATPHLTISGLICNLKDQFSQGFIIKGSGEPTDGDGVQWYAYDKQNVIFLETTAPPK